MANDESCQLYMMEVILKLNNFEVTTAQNGFEAFELASEAYRYQQSNIKQIVDQWSNHSFMAQVQMYDLVILDLNMPISDGYEACQKICQLYEDIKFFQKIDEGSSDGINSCNQQVKSLKPLILACSGDDVHNPFMQKALNEAGFDEAITAPLKVDYIKGELISMIDANIKNLTESFDTLKMAKP